MNLRGLLTAKERSCVEGKSVSLTHLRDVREPVRYIEIVLERVEVVLIEKLLTIEELGLIVLQN